MNWKVVFTKIAFTRFGKYLGILLYVFKSPNTIFRYRTGSDEDFEALESNKIYVSNMCIQDDGFEGKYNVIFSDNLNHAFLEDTRRNLIQECIEFVRSHFYIACFTESGKDEKMWEQYADNGKGFCIEYNLQGCDKFIFPVIYKNVKEIKYASWNEMEARKFLFVKHSKWEWQNEWRIAWPFYGDPHKGKYIEQPSIVAIYKGKFMEPNKRKRLEEYCDKNMIPLY